MNKEQIDQLALEIYRGTDWLQEISVEQTVVSFATCFLARVDAERAKEGPVAVINFNRMKYVEWFIEPEDTLDAGVLLYTSPQPIPEGYKLVGLEELFVAVEKADAELSKGNNTEALIGIRVCKSIVGLIKSHIANKTTLAAATEVKP